MASLDRDVLGRTEQVLLDDLDDARGRLFDSHAERLSDVCADRLACCVDVEVQRAAGGLARAKAAEDQLGVGDGRQRAAVAVARRAGVGARALRPDEEQSGLVDARDRAAACADRVNVDRRRGYVITGDHDVVAGVHLAARHQQDVAGSAPDLHRDEVSGHRRGVLVVDERAVGGVAVQIERADGGCGAAEQQVHGPPRHLVDRGGATVRLHQQDGVTQPGRSEIVVQRAQVRHDLGRQRSVDDGGGRALVLAHERRDSGRRRDPRAVPLLAHGFGGCTLVGVVHERIHERNGDGLDVVAVELLQHRTEALHIERGVFAAVGVDAPAQGCPQVARHEHRGIRSAVVPLVLAQASADLQRVAEPLGGDQPDGGACAFEHGVGGHRGAVDEQRAVSEHVAQRHAEVHGDAGERSVNSSTRIRRN